MFRHMLKLAWKRKTRNVMLTLEILLAFVIVFAIAAFATRSWQLYHMPVGIEHRDVWSVQLRIPHDVKIDALVYENFKRTLEAMPEVELVAFAATSPFTNSTWRTEVTAASTGRQVDTDMLRVTDSFFDVTGMKLVQGRWFSAEDDGADAIPVIINRRLADTLAPGKSPLGLIFQDGDAQSKERSTMKVTGVVEALRNKGEFMAPTNILVQRVVIKPQNSSLQTIMLRLVPGTPRGFEAALARQLLQVRNDFNYQIAPLSELRTSQLRSQIIPLAIMSVVAGFLLIMVAFGLFGVLWQNTTQRIPEIGLRRALGASGSQIYRQIIAEQLLLSTAAMLLALILLIQLPITAALGEHLSWTVFLWATALSMGVIYLISLLCSLYPGWRASRLSPTEALHYE
jgi:putative ABC transport system permease protein